MRQADAAMDSIEALLLSVPEDTRAAGCDDVEIQKRCKACKRLFQCFDASIHCCQQPFGTLTDTNMAKVRTLINILDRLWRRLLPAVPPKAHALWHLLDDLGRLRGLKHHSESKIEVAHQVGRKVDLSFRSVNDIDKKIECSLRHQHTMGKASMQLTQAELKESRSRKRPATAIDDDEQEADRHGKILELSNLPEIVEVFPTLESLAIASGKLTMGEEANNNDAEVAAIADVADADVNEQQQAQGHGGEKSAVRNNHCRHVILCLLIQQQIVAICTLTTTVSVDRCVLIDRVGRWMRLCRLACSVNAARSVNQRLRPEGISQFKTLEIVFFDS